VPYIGTGYVRVGTKNVPTLPVLLINRTAQIPPLKKAGDEIRDAVLLGEIIEEYPEDQRGESYLLFHAQQNRAIHVVCAPKAEYLAIITAYLPAPDQWSPDLKVRR